MIVQSVKQNSTAFSAILDGPDTPDSSRNNTLTSIAGRLHDGTRSQEKLVEDLHKVNKARCKPPLPKSEVRRIAESIYKREPCRPGAAKPPEEVIEFVERHIAGVLEGRAWKGVAGASDRKVYDGRLEVG